MLFVSAKSNGMRQQLGERTGLLRRVAHRLVLLADLFAAVEDDVQVLRPGSLHRAALEIANEHGQLLRPTRLVGGAQQMLVLRRDFRVALLGIGEVRDEDVLAKWSISVR